MIGSAGFGAGFFGPMILLPSNNLAPLLGFFVTGPYGASLGMAIGLGLSVRQTARTQLREATGWLAFNFILQCSMYHFHALLGGSQWACIAIPLMMLNLGVAGGLLVHAMWTLRAEPRVAAIAITLMLGAIAIIVMSIFPPVGPARWTTAHPQYAVDLPQFVFILDARLEGSQWLHGKRWALLAMNPDRWRLQVGFTLVVVAGLCAVICRWPRREAR